VASKHSKSSRPGKARQGAFLDEACWRIDEGGRRSFPPYGRDAKAQAKKDKKTTTLLWRLFYDWILA
jgi:hypothetical protein